MTCGFLQINRFLEILLKSELNADNRYEKFRDEEDKTKKTLMHYAAELNFPHVTVTLAKKCPHLLALKTKAQLKPEKRGLLPVELALTMENDDVAAYLIRMMRHERYVLTEFSFLLLIVISQCYTIIITHKIINGNWVDK